MKVLFKEEDGLICRGRMIFLLVGCVADPVFTEPHIILLDPDPVKLGPDPKANQSILICQHLYLGRRGSPE